MNAPVETDEMTASAETAADQPIVQEDDQIVRPESDFDLAGASSEETAADQPIVQEDDRVVRPESDFDLAGAASEDKAEDHRMVPEDDQMVAEDDRDMPRGATDADSAMAEPGVTDVSDAGSPSAVVPAPDVEPEPTHVSPVADDSTSADARWHEILTMFVDDPRSSIELAAGLVDDSAEALVMFVQERQHALLSAWQGDDAGTEEMRVALQQYRTFWNRIEDLSRA